MSKLKKVKYEDLGTGQEAFLTKTEIENLEIKDVEIIQVDDYPLDVEIKETKMPEKTNK